LIIPTARALPAVPRHRAAKEEVPPPPCDLVVGPAGHDVGAISQNHVEVVAHHGKTEHVDPELTGEEFDSILNPLLAVIEVLPCQPIAPAEERPLGAPPD